MVVRRRTDQVNNALIAAGTVRGAHILLAKHRVVLLLLLLLECEEHIVQLFDALLDCSNLLLQGLLVGDQVLQLVDQVLQPLHHSRFQIAQVILRRCVLQLLTELIMLTRILCLVLLKLFK